MNNSYNELTCPYCGETGPVEKQISLSSFKFGWNPQIQPGKRSPVKKIGNQIYDEESYNRAKKCGRITSVRRIKAKSEYNVTR
jgi:hypothetical protein